MTNVAWRDYDTASEMASAVADRIGLFVEAALDSRGEALVPGGKSPFPCLNGWQPQTSIGAASRSFPLMTASSR